MKNLYLLLVLLLLPAAPATAAPLQDHEQIRTAIAHYVRSQTQSLPGKVDIKVNRIDDRLRLDACPKMEVFLPPNGHLLGNGTVGVRCPQTSKVKGWRLFVPVQVKVTTTLLVSSQPLPRGKLMAEGDFTGQSGIMNQADMVIDPNEIVGKVLKYSIGAGQVIRRNMLRDPYAVTQGQTVPVVVEGQGFKVRSQGRALNNAAEGETVQVRTESGRVVSGTANENGEVSVRP